MTKFQILTAKFKDLFKEELIPIDLPTDGQRIVFQRPTVSGGYPMVHLENREHIAMHTYFATLRKAHLSENQQMTRYLPE